MLALLGVTTSQYLNLKVHFVAFSEGSAKSSSAFSTQNWSQHWLGKGQGNRPVLSAMDSRRGIYECIRIWYQRPSLKGDGLWSRVAITVVPHLITPEPAPFANEAQWTVALRSFCRTCFHAQTSHPVRRISGLGDTWSLRATLNSSLCCLLEDFVWV